jgi:hypothetical protein
MVSFVVSMFDKPFHLMLWKFSTTGDSLSTIVRIGTSRVNPDSPWLGRKTRHIAASSQKPRKSLVVQ